MIFSYIIFTISIYNSFAFHSDFMCNNELVTDCSFQIPSSLNSCLIYNTEVCKKSFADLFPHLPPLSELSTEENAPFEVSLAPYTAYINGTHRVNPFSALNITVTLKQKTVDAFSLMLSYNEAAKNICRIFDFRQVSDQLQYPVTFFYDCFNKLAEKNIKSPEFFLTAYPLNVRLRYLVFIPPAFEKQLDPACSWNPLIMVLLSGLKDGFIELKFTRAPEALNALFYSLTLLDPSGDVKGKVTVFDYDGAKMCSSSFSGVSSGFYSLTIGVGTRDRASCPDVHSPLFYVGEEYTSTSRVTLLVLCVLSFALTLLSCASCCLFYLHRKHCSTEKTIVLIFSCDSPQYMDLVLSIKPYLERKFNLVIHSIYKTGQDAYSFILAKFSEADALVFVLSEGIYQAIEKKNISSLQHNHPCQNQLQKAFEIYSSKFHKLGGSRKNDCAISFPPFKSNHIPKLLKPMRCFDLPKDEHKFIFFLFHCLWCRWHCWVFKGLKHDDAFNKCLENMKKTWSVSKDIALNANNLSDDFAEATCPSDDLYSESDSLAEPEIDLKLEKPAKDQNFDIIGQYIDNYLLNR